MTVSTPTVPLTLLQAVNEMLAAVGVAQVETLDNTVTGLDADRALNTISDVSVQVQSEGWFFNEDIEYPLTPEAVNGYIVLPPNVLKCSLNRRSAAWSKAAVRNGMLWDLNNFTFTWIKGSSGVTTPQPLSNSVLYVDIRWAFPYEQLDQALRWLIMCKAARMFAVGRVPDANTWKFTDQVYEEAIAAAWQWDTDQRAAWPSEQNPHFFTMRQR